MGAELLHNAENDPRPSPLAHTGHRGQHRLPKTNPYVARPRYLEVHARGDQCVSGGDLGQAEWTFGGGPGPATGAGGPVLGVGHRRAGRCGCHSIRLHRLGFDLRRVSGQYCFLLLLGFSLTWR